MIARARSPQTPEGLLVARAPMTPDISLLPEAVPAEAGERGHGLSRQGAAELFAEHCDYVWNALRRLGVARDDLEDLSHDTFVAVFRQWHAYDQTCDLGIQGEPTRFELHWDGDALEGSVSQTQLLFLDRVP